MDVGAVKTGAAAAMETRLAKGLYLAWVGDREVLVGIGNPHDRPPTVGEIEVVERMEMGAS